MNSHGWANVFFFLLVILGLVVIGSLPGLGG